MHIYIKYKKSQASFYSHFPWLPSRWCFIWRGQPSWSVGPHLVLNIDTKNSQNSSHSSENWGQNFCGRKTFYLQSKKTPDNLHLPPLCRYSLLPSIRENFSHCICLTLSEALTFERRLKHLLYITIWKNVLRTCF